MNQENHLDDKSEGFSPFKFFVIFFIFLILLNLIYIDILTFKGPKSDIIPATPLAQKPIQKENDICPQSCVSQIYEATASYKLATTPAITSIDTKVSSKVKEFFISFGSGLNSSSDWQDVEALQAYVDSANYEDLKSMVFEASVHVPTGNQTASVRLFNATDKHPVWFSEVLFNGGGNPQFLISKPIKLDEGNKLYKVQMKTELQFKAVLDQARIHIIIN